MKIEEAIECAMEEYSFADDEARDPLSAFLTSLRANGYAVVPVEATEEMADAASE